MFGELLEGNENYVKIKDLSRGTYGCVVLAKRKEDDEEVALKFIERGGKITTNVQREILNHRKLDHPHVIILQEVFPTPNHLVLVLEYANRNTVRHLLSAKGRLSEAEARRLFQQLMLAVDYCHRMGVANRDIKPENTLLNFEGQFGANGDELLMVKLADFGYSKDEDTQSLAATKLGTPAYMAPEVLKSTGPTYDSKKVDVWSSGTMLFQMVCGVLPFQRAEDKQLTHMHRTEAMFKRVINAEYAFPPGVPVTEKFKSLIGCMLVTDPKKRFSVKEVMQHPWFVQDLVPGALLINKMLVQESKANAPSEEEVAKIIKIVEEAQTVQTAGNLGHRHSLVSDTGSLPFTG